jgi:hypothetical protein
MNESNAPVRSSTIEPAPVRPADVAPPRRMERVEPPTPPIRKPAEITPSKPIIKEKTTIIPPPITPEIKPADVTPPKKKTSDKVTPDVSPPKRIEDKVIHPDVAPPTTNIDIREVDNTDDENKRKEIKTLRNLQKKANRTEAENILFNSLKQKYTGVKQKLPKEVSESITKLQAAFKRSTIQPIFNEGLENVRASSTLQAAIKRNQNQQKLQHDLASNTAATKIQSAMRNKKQ